MRVPMSWLRELTELPDSTTTLQVSEALTRAGLQVERIEAIGAELTGPIVVGRVLDFVEEPQKNGKTMRWCQVDVGEKAPRGIICGADNFQPGDFVVVALPGAVLPGDFTITSRKTYGHISDGMICAADELGLGDDHSGIWVLPPESLTPGSDAIETLGVRDEVLEIDVTPDIGYCLSMRGVAREVAQAFGMSFSDPYSVGQFDCSDEGYPIRLESEKCSLYVARNVTGLDPEAPTPVWMSTRLIAAGMRPISLGVDITNYVMLESGQPLHAYDADKLAGTIVVREAQPGEQLRTLDGVDRSLSLEDLLICDDSGPIGLAGVMGGETTEMDENTTNVVLEGACFDPVAISRTFRRHKLASEASTRFARGVDSALAVAATRTAARLMARLGGAKVAETRTIIGRVDDMLQQSFAATLPASILGVHVNAERVVEVLRASGCTVEGYREGREDDILVCTPPTWRRDLVDPYDYVEEVGRKIGFGSIAPVLPQARVGSGYTFEQRSRRSVLHAVAAAGFTETITLPFMSDEDLASLGADDERTRTVRLANPLADTQPYMRTTLLPGLFRAVAKNTSRSQTDVAIFECGSVFRDNEAGAAAVPSTSRRPSDDEIASVISALPEQPGLIAGVICGMWRPAGWQGPAEKADWRHAVYFAQTACESLGVAYERVAARRAPWHPGRCAELRVGESVIGYAGELHPSVIKAFGLPARTCAVEIDLDTLIRLAPRGGEVSSISPFPLDKEDVALVVDESVSAKAVEDALRRGAGDLLESIRLFDIYVGDQAGAGKKSLAFAMGFRAPDRTLKQAEVARFREAAVANAERECGAKLRA